MTLITSVSGIRGTIGGPPGDNLTPPDIVAFVSAYGHWLKTIADRPCVVVGRDGRMSGQFVRRLVVSTLEALGIDVLDADYSTTPSVEMYVVHAGATGGIIITASHNPAAWNALKFLNAAGEFISEAEGLAIRTRAGQGLAAISYATVESLGCVRSVTDVIPHHISAILAHPLVDAARIAGARLSAVVDCINSTGSISLPPLLDALGVTYTLLHADLSGQFAHNPEPLPEHLDDLCNAVRENGASIGISVDPDVDRLALVDETGAFVGEEYTLVCAADYVLGQQPGPVVTNLSSSLALRDLASRFGQPCYFAPVGEVHVVSEMKARGAVLGGEGNGGVIDPSLHYGRDALLGVALVLMNLATSGKSLSALKAGYSRYEMVKDKIAFPPNHDPSAILEAVAGQFRDADLDTRDGLKISFPAMWVHLRKSNTEPILRIYAEAPNRADAEALAARVRDLIPRP